jgi:hypothetical protein
MKRTAASSPGRRQAGADRVKNFVVGNRIIGRAEREFIAKRRRDRMGICANNDAKQAATLLKMKVV